MIHVRHILLFLLCLILGILAQETSATTPIQPTTSPVNTESPTSIEEQTINKEVSTNEQDPNLVQQIASKLENNIKQQSNNNNDTTQRNTKNKPSLEACQKAERQIEHSRFFLSKPILNQKQEKSFANLF